MTRSFPSLGLLTLMVAHANVGFAQRPTTLAGRSTVYAPQAIAATSQPLASAAALEVMRTGVGGDGAAHDGHWW